MHDSGVDLSAQMDFGKAVRPGRVVQRVNVDFPVDMLREIDQEARRRNRQRPARRSSSFFRVASRVSTSVPSIAPLSLSATRMAAASV